MNDYNTFSLYYDSLTQNVEYARRSAYLLKLFKKFDRQPSLLLDLACGTGGFSIELAKAGIDIIGVDPSQGMLSVAREKADAAGVDILFLCQSAEQLELYGTVDGAVCCLDSLNHITNYRNFCRAVSRTALFLEPHRLFIFDVNTEYKQREILGNSAFITENDNVLCTWQNSYNPKTRITDIALDFFEHTDNNCYTRSHEDIRERVYTSEEITAALSAASLEVVACFDEQSFSTPRQDSQRIIYVTRKE